MSAPINFNTTSLDELKTVLSKNKAQAVIKAREKFGHLSITAFRTAAKLSTAQCQKMLNGGAIIYEVDTSAPILPEDTPPTSEDSSPIQADETAVAGATSVSSQPGFVPPPARLSFTPSGPPYVDAVGGRPSPSDGATGDPPSRPSQERTTTPVEGDPAPQTSVNPSSESSLKPRNQLSTGSRGTPTPTSPTADDQLKALQEELAKMRDEREVKKSENLDFRQKLTTAEYHLATSQGEVLRVQQQLGEAQQAAADSAQKAEEYQQAVQEAEEQSQ